MTRLQHTPRSYAVSAVGALLLTAALASAQTQIAPPNNKYSPEQDVKLGQEAAAEVRRQMPQLNDDRIDDYVERIGDRLVDEIPAELRQPAFRYSFDVVNLKDINAFALPGGPMFLNRGMLEAAKTEGEIAGVMAHELSHVVLRHGTAQATKGEKFQIGAVAGQILGAIIGGTAGSIVSQGSQFGLGAYFLKYSREYERQADLMGSQIMARAGYDPRQMAHMFETIQRQGGNRAPEWLSSHPDPGNRSQAINREAESLRVQASSGSPAEFNAVQARLRQMSPALTAEQAARQQPRRSGSPSPVGTGGRAVRVEPPSADWQTHQPANFLRISVPANWERVGGNNTVTYAPDGAYFESRGTTAFTHGVEIGVLPSQSIGLQEATEQLLRQFAQSNPELRRQGGYQRTSLGGRSGLRATLTNVSEVTGAREFVDVGTVQLADGSVLFVIGVAPQTEAGTYQHTFNRVRQTLQIADRVSH